MEKRKSNLTTHTATWISRNDDLVTEIWYWVLLPGSRQLPVQGTCENVWKGKDSPVSQSKTGKEKEIEMVLQDPVMEVGE